MNKIKAEYNLNVKRLYLNRRRNYDSINKKAKKKERNILFQTLKIKI